MLHSGRWPVFGVFTAAIRIPGGSNKVGRGQVSCVLPAFGKERSEQQGDGTEGVFFCKKILKK